jgi:hypothetical protein
VSEFFAPGNPIGISAMGSGVGQLAGGAAGGSQGQGLGGMLGGLGGGIGGGMFGGASGAAGGGMSDPGAMSSIFESMNPGSGIGAAQTGSGFDLSGLGGGAGAGGGTSMLSQLGPLIQAAGPLAGALAPKQGGTKASPSLNPAKPTGDIAPKAPDSPAPILVKRDPRLEAIMARLMASRRS